MANNLRGHVVPPATGQSPSRQTFLDMMMSVKDIVTVDDDTDRQSLVSGLAAAGYTITADNPLYVHNKGQAAGMELQQSINGSHWETFAARQDTGWVSLSVASGWSADSLYWRVQDGGLSLRGEVWGGTNGSLVCTLPVGARPASRLSIPVARTGTATAYDTLVNVVIETTGAMSAVELMGSIPVSSPGVGFGAINFPAEPA